MSRTYAALLALVTAAGLTLAGPTAAHAQPPVGVQVGVGPVNFSYQQGYQTFAPTYPYGGHYPHHHHHHHYRPYGSYSSYYAAPTTVVVPAYTPVVPSVVTPVVPYRGYYGTYGSYRY